MQAKIDHFQSGVSQVFGNIWAYAPTFSLPWNASSKKVSSESASTPSTTPVAMQASHDSSTTFQDTEPLKSTTKPGEIPRVLQQTIPDPNNVSEGAFSDLIRRLLDIRNILHSCGKSDIPIPNVVVIGSQSAGKSSVLEALVGHEFLPK